MTDHEIHQIKVASAKKEQLAAEIKLCLLEMAVLDEKMKSVGWEPITWDQLAAELRKTNHAEDYERNPIVASQHHKNHCHINAAGNLQIGAYEQNDQFPKGCDLFVSFPRRSWS
jgi:hypothetical protein